MMTVLSFLLVATQEPAKVASATMFFEGFSAGTFLTVCLQACKGLLVSRLLKYADANFKNVAQNLRGPILVLLTTAPPITIVSSLTVATGCFTYLYQGPLK